MGKTTIKNSMTWKLQGTASGQNTIAMPSNFNEVMYVVTYGAYFFSGVIPKDAIGASNIYPRFTYFYSSSNYCGGYVKVNESTINADNLVENGVNKVTSASLKLYYR